MTRDKFMGCVFLLAFLAAADVAIGQTRRALLIGINTYQPVHTKANHPADCAHAPYGRCDLSAFDNLAGAVNDVVAMRDLLTSPKFGFPRDKVVALTNPALATSQLGETNLSATLTTHDGILAVMKKYLVEQPQRDDTVVFYYSGHGSLRINSKGTKLTVVDHGAVMRADSTIVPSDVWTGAYDIRDREMTRLFNAALDKGVKLTVILDSCYSGGLTRGIGLRGNGPRKRWVPYDPRDVNEGPDLLPNGQPVLAPAARTDNPALIYSAAQQDEAAQEAPPPDSIPKPHGLFTYALIKALQILPIDTPSSVVNLRVKAEMEGIEEQEQTASLDAGKSRLAQPLFGGMAKATGAVRAAVIGKDLDGNILLDIGRLASIGPDSEFASLVKNAAGQQITIRVTELDGITKSRAELVTPSGAKVESGDVFELTKWIPPPSPPLRLWTWSTNVTGVQLQAAVDQVKASHIQPVDDPAEQPWTDMLFWDGSQWLVQHTGSQETKSVGTSLTTQVINEQISSAAKVWVNLPPPKELASQLKIQDPNFTRDYAIESVADMSNADYILAGTLNAGEPSWSWFHKAEFLRGPVNATSQDHTPGCSTTSRYPVRTGWVSKTHSDGTDAAEKLNLYASRLSKVNGWLNLVSTPTGVTSRGYYDLQFIRASDQKTLADGETVKQGDDMRMALTTSAAVTNKRWVYVLDINCQGEGTLVYPIQPTVNEFPNNASQASHADLQDGFSVDEPYGLDTFIFLSTPEALPDPAALSFEGIKGAHSATNPLQRLLVGTSAGTRGVHVAIPMDWGISLESLRTMPN